MIVPFILELRVQQEWSGGVREELPLLYKWSAAGSGSGRTYDMILTNFDAESRRTHSIVIRSEDVPAGSTIYNECLGLVAINNWPLGDNQIIVEVGRAEPRVSHPDPRKPYEDWTLIPTDRKTAAVRVKE